jgi:hypothetical protein
MGTSQSAFQSPPKIGPLKAAESENGYEVETFRNSETLYYFLCYFKEQTLRALWCPRILKKPAYDAVGRRHHAEPKAPHHLEICSFAPCLQCIRKPLPRGQAAETLSAHKLHQKSTTNVAKGCHFPVLHTGARPQLRFASRWISRPAKHLRQFFDQGVQLPWLG